MKLVKTRGGSETGVWVRGEGHTKGVLSRHQALGPNPGTKNSSRSLFSPHLAFFNTGNQ